MIFDILESKLIADGFTSGRDLFRGYMPADISVGVMLRLPLQGIPIDPFIRDHYRGRLQVITRHRDGNEGARMAMRVQKLLTSEGREVYPATAERGEAFVDFFIPETLPIDFPRLEGNGYEWSQHFETVFGVKLP